MAQINEGLRMLEQLDSLPEFDTPEGSITASLKALKKQVIEEVQRRVGERKPRGKKPEKKQDLKPVQK
jgi:hypothetical protein